MSMAWLILFALATENAGRTAPSGLACARPGREVTASAPFADASRSHSMVKKAHHRASGRPLAWNEVEPFDTEEVDETWMVHLDVVATVPGSWLIPARPLPGLRWVVVDRAGLAHSSLYPLRC